MLAQSKGAYFYFDLFIPILDENSSLSVKYGTRPDQPLCALYVQNVSNWHLHFCTWQMMFSATVPCTPFNQSNRPLHTIQAKQPSKCKQKTKESQDLTKLHLGPFGCIIKALPTLKCRSTGRKNRRICWKISFFADKTSLCSIDLTSDISSLWSVNTTIVHHWVPLWERRG